QRQALALYQQQLQLAPGDVDAMVAAAGSAAALRDMETAEYYLEQALARQPQSPDVLAGAGRVYRSAGQNRKAERYFRAAIAALAGSGGRAFNPFAGLTGGQARGNALRGERFDPLAAQVAAAPAAPMFASSAPVAVQAPVQAVAYDPAPVRGNDLPPPAVAQ